MRDPRDGERMLPQLLFMAMSQVIAQGLNVLALVLVARKLGTANFGVLQLGATVSMYALLAGEFGLLPVGIRELARIGDPDRARRYVREHMGLLLMLCLIVLPAGFLALRWLPFYAAAPAVYLLYLAIVPIQAISCDWVSTGLGAIRWTGIFLMLRSLFYFGAVLAIFQTAQDSTLELFPLAFLIAFLLASTAVALRMTGRLGGALLPAIGSRLELRRRLREATPIGASLLVLRLLTGIDVVILGSLKGSEAVGIYSAALKLAAVLFVASDVVWRVLLPRLSRSWEESPAAFRAQFGRLAGLAVIGLLPVALGASFEGTSVSDFIYDVQYAESGALLQLLGVAYSLLALGMFLGNGLIASDRQRRYLPGVSAAAALAVVLHFILIPKLGPAGAAWSTLAAASLLVAANGWQMRSSLGKEFGRGLLVAAPAAVVMLLGFTLPLSAALRIAAGVSGYALVAAVGILRLRLLKQPDLGE